MIPSVVAFDLDNTLARSKSAIEPDMAALLGKLLVKAKVAVTSGGKLEQLVAQVADKLPQDADFHNLLLLPTSGAELWVRDDDGQWNVVYEELLSEEELVKVHDAILAGAKAAGVIDFDAPSYGERIELRGAEVTLSALGQKAPVEEKEAWDPTHEKREALRAAIATLLPDYDVKMGGSTSIDVTKKGVNKAFGIRKLSEYLSLPIDSMLYVGDALGPEGNDEVVKETGIRTHAVADPAETAAFIESLIG